MTPVPVHVPAPGELRMAGDKLTDEFLMQVADVWRQAYGAADPVEAVREAGNTTRQTARAWITAARTCSAGNWRPGRCSLSTTGLTGFSS